MAVVMHDSNGNMQNEWEMSRWPETGEKQQKWRKENDDLIVIVLCFLMDFVENDMKINK